MNYEFGPSTLNCIYCHHKCDDGYEEKIMKWFICEGCNVSYCHFYGNLRFLLFRHINYLDYELAIDLEYPSTDLSLRIRSTDNESSSREIFKTHNLVWIFPQNVEYWIQRFKRLNILS